MKPAIAPKLIALLSLIATLLLGDIRALISSTSLAMVVVSAASLIYSIFIERMIEECASRACSDQPIHGT